jgi:hypothetical protein
MNGTETIGCRGLGTVCWAKSETFVDSATITPQGPHKRTPNRPNPTTAVYVISVIEGNQRLFVADMLRKTGQSVCYEVSSVSDLESDRLAGFSRYIWSNLCTRNILKKITPRGHQDWPDIRRYRKVGIGQVPKPAESWENSS